MRDNLNSTKINYSKRTTSNITVYGSYGFTSKKKGKGKGFVLEIYIILSQHIDVTSRRVVTGDNSRQRHRNRLQLWSHASCF